MEFRGKIQEKIQAQEMAVCQELSDLTRSHVEQSGGLLQHLPIDLEQHEAQRLTVNHVDGYPQDADTVDRIATSVESRFPSFLQRLENLESRHGELSRIGEMIEAGNNVILVTNHGDIKDIVYVLAAFYSGLQRHDYQPTTSLIMSKMIAFLGAEIEGNVTPAIDVLKLLCDKEYFSFPRTPSIANSKIKDEAVTLYNARLRSAMSWQLRKGGNLMAIAASGTTDKPDNDHPDTINMEPIGHGTAKVLASRKNNFVVPVAVWLNSKDPLFEVCDIPRHISNEEEAHDVMRLIAHRLNECIVDYDFVYRTPPQKVGRVALND